MAAFTDRTTLEATLIAAAGLFPSSIIDSSSSAELPHFYWTATNAPTGSDGTGNGTFSHPFKTIKRAIRECKDGRGDYVLIAPGSYAETIDIGSGSTSSGSLSTDGYQKRNLHLIGTPQGGHNGIVQIIGDGSTAQPTLRVKSGYATGFVLKGLELDTNGLSQAALEIQTSDTGAAPAASSAYYRWLIEDVAIRSNDPAVGFLFTGATLGTVKRCSINGPTVANIAFGSSASNNPSDITLEDLDLFNGFSGTTTADIATLSNTTSFTLGSNGTLVNILFKKVTFGSAGTSAGGSTNYINLASATTCTNVMFRDCSFGTAAANGSAKVATLPTNVVVLGHGTSGLVSLKG